MSVETTPGAATRAIIHLRGYYALLAGALLLFIVPLYQLTRYSPPLVTPTPSRLPPITATSRRCWPGLSIILPPVEATVCYNSHPS